MKQYYTLKLKLTPKQIEMLEQILSEGTTGVIDDLPPDEVNRIISIENKIDQTLKDSGYNDDWYNNKTA